MVISTASAMRVPRCCVPTRTWTRSPRPQGAFRCRPLTSTPTCQTTSSRSWPKRHRTYQTCPASRSSGTTPLTQWQPWMSSFPHSTPQSPYVLARRTPSTSRPAWMPFARPCSRPPRARSGSTSPLLRDHNTPASLLVSAPLNNSGGFPTEADSALDGDQRPVDDDHLVADDLGTCE